MTNQIVTTIKESQFLSAAGMIVARVILERLTSYIGERGLPESDRVFRSGRGTVDMIFTTRQMQEMCFEQHIDFYIVFIDLLKVFDSVDSARL